DSIVTGDFNSDGKLDLAVNNADSNTVGVFLGNGDGRFQAQRVFTTPGSGPGRLVVGDFNNDGRLDLAVLRSNSNVIALLLGDGAGPDLAYILPGNGDGTFGLAQLFLTQVVPDAVSAADFNGDGALDLAVTNFASNTVSVLAGNGDATFQNQQTFIAGTGPVS